LLNRNRKIILILFIATIFKATVIFLFYQHVIVYDGTKARIAPGYGWDQLVSSMQNGKYEMQIQSGLSDIYNFKSRSYRPATYPIFLYFSFILGNGSALFLVFLQSIVTSMVAFLGYEIIKLSSMDENRAIACMIILFLFPMNFLKSGSIDEAPLFLVFLLLFLITFTRYIKDQRKVKSLFMSGISLGISTLTRYTAIFVPFFMIPFIFFSRETKADRAKKVLVFFFSFFLVLVPWLARNYLIYGKVVLSSGSNRIIFVTLTKDFIHSFPHQSVDEIERKYLREFHKSNRYLSNRDELAIDKEFFCLAVHQIRQSPPILLKSFLTKLKVFFPTKYYPDQNNIIRDMVFLFGYYLIVLFFIISIVFKFKQLRIESILLIIMLLATAIPGLLYFMLSRHFYVPMMLMIIFSCLNLSLKQF